MLVGIGLPSFFSCANLLQHGRQPGRLPGSGMSYHAQLAGKPQRD